MCQSDNGCSAHVQILSYSDYFLGDNYTFPLHESPILCVCPLIRHFDLPCELQPFAVLGARGTIKTAETVHCCTDFREEENERDNNSDKKKKKKKKKKKGEKEEEKKLNKR